MNVNLKYKNSVFSFLFSNPDVLRELYCALNGATLPHDVPVVINTLEDVLFMSRINDISFEIGGRLVVLIEHQSTINPNMAVRLLMYIARVYEKSIASKNIYSTKKLSIPQPEFFVLYNGTAPYPDKAVLKLSDLFKSIEPLGIEQSKPVLELEVMVLNINEGKNEDIVQHCSLLAQYRAFIAKVREYQKDGSSLQDAIKNAVIYCHDHDILRELMEQHSTEVMNMLMTEWNWDDAKEVWQEESREEEREKIARNALAKGYPVEEVISLTGLDLETLKNIEKRQN